MPNQDWRQRLDDADGGSSSSGGRARVFLRRVFGDGENPLRWGIPLYTAFGIRVRLHVLYAAYIVSQLVWAAFAGSGFGFGYMLATMGSLFVLVLLHEYGHCFACRRVGGEADEIMMWPLGGLASCLPPRTWRAELITVLGGPGVNAVLFPVLFVATWAASGTLRSVVFNPFAPEAAIASLATPSTVLTYALVTLWGLYYTNGILLAFNMLVPMFPMDAGRVLHCALWRAWEDEHRALRTTVMVGLVAAGLLAVVAIVSNQMLLLAIAAFGGITCYMERQRLRFAELGGLPLETDVFTPSREAEPEGRAGPSKREVRRRQREAEEQAEIDRILAKISATGMGSLTGKEKRALRRASERARQGAGR